MSGVSTEKLLEQFVSAFEECRRYLFECSHAGLGVHKGQRVGDKKTLHDFELLRLYKEEVDADRLLFWAEEDVPDFNTTQLRDYEYLVIIDPLDGTNNMLGNLPFGVNVAFGRIKQNHGDFTIGDLQGAFVADYLSKRKYMWCDGKTPRVDPPLLDGKHPFDIPEQSASIFEVPDEYSYNPPDYPLSRQRQVEVLRALRMQFPNLQRRAVDVTGLRMLDVMGDGIIAYADFRRATEVWDTIPSIRMLLELGDRYTVMDADFKEYSLNTALLQKVENGYYRPCRDVGKEVAVLRNQHCAEFKETILSVRASGAVQTADCRLHEKQGDVPGRAMVGLEDLAALMQGMAPVEIKATTIGNLNVGEQEEIGTLAVRASTLVGQDHKEMAAALVSVASEIARSSEVATAERDELLKTLVFIGEQALLPKENRQKTGVLMRNMNRIATLMQSAGGLAGVWSTWGQQIKSFFGL